MMETLDVPENTTIIHIHQNAKYVMRLGEEINDEEMRRIAEQLSNWWDMGAPILVVPPRFTLVRVDKLEDEDVQEKEED